MNDSIYRCKCCGQLVNPERNKVCPACKAPLRGNIQKEKSQKNPSNFALKEIKRGLIRLGLGLLFLYVFFYKVIPYYFVENTSIVDHYSQKMADAMLEPVKKQVEENQEILEEKKNIKTETQKEPEEEFGYQTLRYFIKKEDVHFSKTNQSRMYIPYGNNGILEFSVRTYWNGDVWINGPIYFIPFDKTEIDGQEVQLLYYSKNQTYLPNIAYADYGRNLSEYKEVQDKILTFYKDVMLNGDKIDALIVKENEKDHVILQNVTVHYEFIPYKKIKVMDQAGDKIVYELEDGTRLDNYLDIPYTLIVDEVSEEYTTLVDSIEIEIK